MNNYKFELYSDVQENINEGISTNEILESFRKKSVLAENVEKAIEEFVENNDFSTDEENITVLYDSNIEHWPEEENKHFNQNDYLELVIDNNDGKAEYHIHKN